MKTRDWLQNREDFVKRDKRIMQKGKRSADNCTDNKK